MSALIRHLAARLTRRHMRSWTCDQCKTVNTDSVTSCYKCGS